MLRPLARPEGVCCGCETESRHIIRGLLALDDDGLRCREKFLELVRDDPNVALIVNPSTVSIWPPDPK